MRRLLAVVAAALVAPLAGCPSDAGPAGKVDGEACGAGAECRTGLCFRGRCASSTPPAASCTLPGGAPVIVDGGPIVATEPAPGLCVAPQRAVVGAPAFVDLGPLAAGTAVGFDVPAGTTSLTILSQAEAGSAEPFVVYRGYAIPNSVVPTDLREPGGALYYSDTDPLPRSGAYDDPTQALAYYGGWSPVSGAFTIPNTAASLDRALGAGALPAGRWTFTVNDFARECASLAGCQVGTRTGTYRVQVLADTQPFASTGRLDLEVYLATSSTSRLPDAAAALADPLLARWVASVGQLLAGAGLCLGTVSVHDLPAWAKTRYAPGGIVDVSGAGEAGDASRTLPGCDYLSQLFTLGIAPARAVHVFLADELVDGGAGSGLTVLGVDGSIPGPSGAPGTVNGGAVVGLFDLLGAGTCGGGPPDPTRCGTDVLAYVTAHEAGHWLGLYHTTELTGAQFDPLGDTATCPCLACAPFPLRGSCAERGLAGEPTYMMAGYCAGRRPRCGGGRNLMFWLFDPRTSAGELSPQQGEVVRLNPAVRREGP